MPSDIMVGKMEVLSRFFGEGAAFQVMLGRTNESRVGAAGGCRVDGGGCKANLSVIAMIHPPRQNAS